MSGGSGKTSSPAGVLFLKLYTPFEAHDRLLVGSVGRFMESFVSDRRCISTFFVRYADPKPHLRLRVLGSVDWLGHVVRRRAVALMARTSRLVSEVQQAPYKREFARYGGIKGMALCERLFLFDSVFCVRVIRSELSRGLRISRRALSVLWTEKLLQVMGLDRKARGRWYRKASVAADAFDLKGVPVESQEEPDLVLFTKALNGGVRQVVEELSGRYISSAFQSCWRSITPVVRELVRVRKSEGGRPSINDLALSLAHMNANRLGLSLDVEFSARRLMNEVARGSDRKSPHTVAAAHKRRAGRR